MMKSAFTLIETLCVCVILAVLASILFPVGARAIASSRETSQVQRMKQLHIALKLYQGDYGGEGVYGTSDRMGLPVDGFQFQREFRNSATTKSLMASACGRHPNLTLFPGDSYIYYPTNRRPEFGGGWNKYVQLYQEDAVLFIDPNCTSHSVPLYDPFFEKKLLGVTLGGRVRKKKTYEYPDLMINWADDPARPFP